MTKIKIVWQCHKNRNIYQWDMIARNKPVHKGQLIYNKRGKTIQWGKDSLFNKKCWENWTLSRKNETRPPSHIVSKNKLKMD